MSVTTNYLVTGIVDSAVQALVSGDGKSLVLAAGADTTGALDSAAAVQAAIDAFVVPGATRFLDFKSLVNAAGRIKINSGLVIPLPAVSVDFGGLIIDARDMTSGTAITFTGQNVTPFNGYSAANVIRGLVLLGPDTDATTVDGIKFGLDSTVPGHAAIENVFIKGFRDNLVVNSNFYIAQFRNLFLNAAHRYGLNYAGTTNSGESINFFGGSFSDCRNTAGTAIGLYVPSAASGPDMIFHGTSFSYDDVAFDVQCGAANFLGCHFENITENPMGKVQYVGGRPSTNVALIGGQVTHGTLVASQSTGGEVSTGRAVMFDINSTAGDRLLFQARGVRYGGFGKKTTQFVRFTGSAFVQVKVKDMSIDQQAANIGRISDYTNMLVNGGFESSVPGGWTATAGGTTITRDTSEFNADTAGTGGAASLKIVAAAQTATYTQDIRVQPGELFILRAFTKLTAFTSGTVTMKAIAYAQDGTTILNTQTLGTVSATQASWTLYSNAYRVVAGTAFVRVELACNTFTGTVYFDDVQAWTL